MKTRRHAQDRNGSAARRQLEFDVIRHHIRKNKAAFIARLERNCMWEGDCYVWVGRQDHKGYGRMNFRYNGRHIEIGVHRLFVILKTRAPIPRGMEAGHIGCKNRLCVRHVELQHYKENAATCQSAKKR